MPAHGRAVGKPGGLLWFIGPSPPPNGIAEHRAQWVKACRTDLVLLWGFAWNGH
jgi:hypothetical protein